MIWLKKILLIIALLLLFGAGYWGWQVYDRTHGIRFYELPIKKPREKVKVSVIVPVYNAEKSLERALDSLRHQTLKDIEFICVNDGSKDSSGAILERYALHDRRFKVIHQQNAFVGAARNRGLDEAQGEYVGFMDNDDWVSPDYFEKLYDAAKEYDADMAVAEKILMVTQEYPLQYINYWLKDEFKDAVIVYDLSHYEDRALGFVWEKIYRRAFLSEHHIRFTTRRTSYEDNFFSTQAYMYANKMAVAHGVTYYYFRGGTSYSLTSAHKPTDEAPEMFMELEQLILNAGLLPEVTMRWRNAARNIRIFSFTDYYRAMTPVDRYVWRQKVLSYFPYDGIDFDALEQEMQQKEPKI